jgi:hypothetical protein
MKPEKVGYWDDRKEKLLKKFENLSQKDLTCNLGEERAMLEALSAKLGKSDKELLSLIISL